MYLSNVTTEHKNSTSLHNAKCIENKLGEIAYYKKFYTYTFIASLNNETKAL